MMRHYDIIFKPTLQNQQTKNSSKCTKMTMDEAYYRVLATNKIFCWIDDR